MSTEILPCPGCGSAMAIREWEDFNRSTVHGCDVICTNCGYQVISGGVSYDAEAIEAHNEIAAAVRDHAAVVAENERLGAQLQAVLDAGDRLHYLVSLAEWAEEDGHPFEEMGEALTNWTCAALAATAPKEAPDA